MKFLGLGDEMSYVICSYEAVENYSVTSFKPHTDVSRWIGIIYLLHI